MEADHEETLDDLLGGRLKVLQKKKGYRFSLDSILLAHFARIRPDSRFVELGLGSGVISLILCYRTGCAAAGLELQEQLADMAARSFRMNRLDHLMEIIRCDLREIKKAMPAGGFDAVVFNPPYRRKGSGRISPNSEKALARHELSGTLADFVAAAEYLAAKAGSVFTVYPATRGVELISRFRNAGIEPKRMRMVHSTERSAAEFILLEAVKGGGEELEIMPPLFVYKGRGEGQGEGRGEYTPETESIFSELCLRQSSSGG
jgi:tRNA1Val (adenine37-N6)-methyltransferase